MYDRQVRRRRVTLLALVVVSLILLTAYFGESSGSPLHTLQRGVISVLSPIQEGASRALKPARDLFGWFGDTLDAKKERDQLRAQRDDLLRRAIGYQVAIEENRELRGLLALRNDASLDDYELVTARIIGRSPINLLHDTITINEGTGSGVDVGDAVVADGGLVGQVTTATGGSAVVTLISDLRSTVTGKLLIGNGRSEIGLVRSSPGDPLDLVMQQLEIRPELIERIEEGAYIVTAGTISSRLQSPYPPNIPIGRATRIDPVELDEDGQLHLSPIADLRHIDFVSVVVDSADPGAQERAQVP